MCPKKLEEKLEDAKLKYALPNVVIPVHMCGQYCDIKKINDLSKIYGFKIIEDASHAIGGSFKGSKVGSCKFSDVAVFSFHPVKIITKCCAYISHSVVITKVNFFIIPRTIRYIFHL